MWWHFLDNGTFSFKYVWRSLTGQLLEVGSLLPPVHGFKRGPSIIHFLNSFTKLLFLKDYCDSYLYSASMSYTTTLLNHSSWEMAWALGAFSGKPLSFDHNAWVRILSYFISENHGVLKSRAHTAGSCFAIISLLLVLVLPRKQQALSLLLSSSHFLSLLCVAGSDP